MCKVPPRAEPSLSQLPAPGLGRTDSKSDPEKKEVIVKWDSVSLSLWSHYGNRHIFFLFTFHRQLRTHLW